MPKFNKPTVRAAVSHPVTTTGPATTYEGGSGYTRDSMSELVLLAVVNMVGEGTFYESAGDRDNRFSDLCRTAALSDPANFLGFLRWLRGEVNMRSASLVAAAVGTKARLDAGADPFPYPLTGGSQADRIEQRLSGPRAFIDAVLQRPDEPGEFLAYWQMHYGRNLPMPVKRGLADAVQRLYSERSLLKYDTESHAIRFGDVLDLAHPSARAPWQGDLFTYALHRRHGHPEQIPESLGMIRANRDLRATAKDEPSILLSTGALSAAGMTWEDALSLAGSKVDKAKLWEAMIPSMGIMALIRNLRNFDEAGVSDDVARVVISKLQDPEQIAKSRQFPYRFLSAYRAAPSLRWAYPLNRAMDAALVNVPRFKGRSLVLIDTSASMCESVSDKSTVRRVDVAALTGVTLAHRSDGPVDLVGFADGAFRYQVTPGSSVITEIEGFRAHVGRVGHGTNTVGALDASFDGHDRVVIVHDGQYGAFRGAWPNLSTVIPKNVPLFSIDTAGYAAAPVDTSKPNRYEVGGFSDKLFTMISMLDGGKSVDWPWVK